MVIESLEKRPQTVQFETHSYCNASCEFCCHSIMTREKGKMSNELIENILKQCNEVNTLIPFLMGEPFMDKRIINIIKKCKELQPQSSVILHSNMSLCTNEHIKEILDNNLVDEIHISFYGINEQQYKQLQGLDYYQVVERIIHFVNERNKRGLTKPLIVCDYILMHELMPLLQQFEKFWRVIVDDVRTVSYDDWHGNQPDRGNEYHPIRLQRIPCYKLWQILNVHWNGEVPLCCMDYNANIVLGDLTKQSLQEVWQGEKLKQIREIHINQEYSKLPMCKHCNSWKCNNPSWWNAMWTIIYSDSVDESL
ncbi:SPASM domain-containing protein [Clostridium sp. 'deep sea']|uniref:radical SAM/SPASM domain-containing protein n=1 Tax=Clostridium sp. 'deep sea' TaxID=2779445 RepID=UPI0018964239|nr:radical SAM/SPASM domain-containing protein [Clostridium sp. 'deep sea']QOR36416.1 SPASM domain-containing protein [Clostridium sp. 'deep sea']